ncbi:DUF4279 domain-containing protein [Xanthomonas massiliensis]|uniref:DUF4279 domain-containing protein n=1 Tax=Xanthomonas massiliensis TaxID=1720302 RepID=UPI00098F8C28
MQLYSHIVDLRISHPMLDPSLVTHTLGLQPQHAWQAGDPRKTPKGTLLAGTRTTGYWAANPFSYGWRESTDVLVEDALDELITFLEPHRDFLVDLSKGGNVCIWASTSSDRNYTLDLSPGMLIRIASLGASFIHDVH